MYLSIGQAAEVIGVSVSTLRRWEKEKFFSAKFRTKGGHRRYCLKEIRLNLLNVSLDDFKDERKTYIYARVSSSDQKLDLKRQEKRLENYCKVQDWDFELISDLGSGINYKKKGLNKLIKLICEGKVSRLVLTHKDRLLRFGSPLLFKLCDFFGCEVKVLENQLNSSFEQELVADVIEIMTVFTAKMYGKRSHRNRKACA
jgi:predicted site-specific integrase-resolvase